MTAQNAQTVKADNLEAVLAQLVGEVDETTAEVEAAPEVVAIEDDGDDDMAEMLAELESLKTEEEIPELSLTTALEENELNELDSTLARNEAYATQESNVNVSTVPPVAGVKQSKPKSVKSTSVAPAKVRDLSALPDEAFQTSLTDTDLAAQRAAVMAKRPTQVKVIEKFDQLWASLHAGAAPSRYVTVSFKVLKLKGTITNAELIAAFEGEGLGRGTAMSQTGQIMVLFDAVGIAKRSGQSLTLNADSAVAEKLSKIIGA